ncbi:MAG: pyridoxal phosphate-dependent aminotransferase [Deltaproteobacteria bacterium]|nr:pyridoxal phosphate-dependent aminotransferase [Deltaproteobacteria bacterium]
MFSRRTGWSRVPNRLAELTARAEGLLDLTESNPTRAGFAAPEFIERLGDARGAAYRPDPRGVLEAREAVAAHYRARGFAISPDAILLTASTSEAYAWLFKLLCDPGDTVLVPTPAYPLLPFLADLEGVTLAGYPLVREERHRVDLAALEARLEETRARAVTVVHPGNPTGHFTRRDEAVALGRLASRHGAALLVDEVFAEHAHGDLEASRLPSFAGGTDALTFVMSGLSKVALAPQLKLGWIVVAGADEVTRREAVERLELVADSYLSVATPVQLALPEILAAVSERLAKVRARLRRNLDVLDAAIRAVGDDGPLRRDPVDGGWYATIQLPRTRTDDEWLEATVAAGVLVHPGYFFDAPTRGLVVVSLLTEEAVFAEGIARGVRLWSAG